MRFFLIFMMAVPAMAASDRVLIKAARYVIQRNEGVKYKPYKDSNGHLTIGIGHKIVAGEKFRQIDDTIVEKLFAKDVQHHLRRCRRFLPQYDSYPVCVQVAILDGFYRGCLSGSPKTLRLIRKGRWTEASVEYLNNREYRISKKKKTGVYLRMKRNAVKFLRYGQKIRG